jgi:hypothetical protein
VLAFFDMYHLRSASLGSGYERYRSRAKIPVSHGVRNGEIWGVTGELAVRYYDKLVMAMVNVSNVYRLTLASDIATAQDALGVPPPTTSKWRRLACGRCDLVYRCPILTTKSRNPCTMTKSNGARS